MYIENGGLFIVNSFITNIVILVGMNMIAVLGVSVLTGFTRLFSFGNAGFMSIGAYTSALLTKHFDVPFVIAIAAGMLLAMIMSVLLGSLTLKLKGDYFLITTLGFGEGIRVLFNYIRPVTGGAQGLSGIPRHTNLQWTLLFVALAFMFCWTLIHSKYGRKLTAIREQEVAAEAVGINIASNKQLAFTVSAALAGLAGALWAHRLGIIEPAAFDLAKSSELTITTVIGGLGSLTGASLGAILITLLPEVFRFLSDYRMLLYGAAVVFIIIVKPSGLYGYKEFSITRVVRWFRKWKGGESA